MTIDRTDTAAKIIQLIASEIQITDITTIKESATFVDLGADSLDMVEIIMKLEEQFGVEISDEDAERLKTVGDVIDYIHAARNKK